MAYSFGIAFSRFNKATSLMNEPDKINLVKWIGPLNHG